MIEITQLKSIKDRQVTDKLIHHTIKRKNNATLHLQIKIKNHNCKIVLTKDFMINEHTLLIIKELEYRTILSFFLRHKMGYRLWDYTKE